MPEGGRDDMGGHLAQRNKLAQVLAKRGSAPERLSLLR
jgi:hypothetical protein